MTQERILLDTLAARLQEAGAPQPELVAVAQVNAWGSNKKLPERARALARAAITDWEKGSGNAAHVHAVLDPEAAQAVREAAAHRRVLAEGLLDVLKDPDETVRGRGRDLARKLLGVEEQDTSALRSLLDEAVRIDRLMLDALEEAPRASPPTAGEKLSSRGRPPLDPVAKALRATGQTRAGAPLGGAPPGGADRAFEQLHPRGRGGMWIQKGEGMKASEPPSPRVQQLQSRLRDLGFRTVLDGRFGVQTEEAVKAFQRTYGLPETGKVNAATVEALRNPPPKTLAQVRSAEKAAAAKTGTRSRSSTSSRSSRSSRGSASPSSSRASSSSGQISLGANDQKGIKDFQRAHGLKTTGKLDATTKAAVQAVNRDRASRGSTSTSGGRRRSAGTSARRVGSTGSGMVRRGDGMSGQPDASVKTIQSALDQLGFELGDGGNDGRFGPDTQRAVEAFQRKYGLRVDGVVGPQTKKMIQRVLRNQQKGEAGNLSVDLLTTPAKTKSTSARSRRLRHNAPEEETMGTEKIKEASYININPNTQEFGTQVPYGGATPFLVGGDTTVRPAPRPEPGTDDLWGRSTPRMPPNLRESSQDEFAQCGTCVHHNGERLCTLYSAGTDRDDLCDSWFSLTPPELRNRARSFVNAAFEVQEAKTKSDGTAITLALARMRHARELLEQGVEEDDEFNNLVKKFTSRGMPEAAAKKAARRALSRKKVSEAKAGLVGSGLYEAGDDPLKLRCMECGHVGAFWDDCPNGHDMTAERRVRYVALEEAVQAETLLDKPDAAKALEEWLLPDDELDEAVLTAKARKQLPKSAFAIPEKDGYPIHDEAHARNALARVTQFGTPEEQRRVRAAVKRRYPHIIKDSETEKKMKRSKQMREAVLTTEKRKKLPKSAFAIPEEEAYPIHDEAHARNALARVSQHGTPEQKKKVRAAVKRRYPNIDIAEATLTAKKRKQLPKSAFAIPPDKYPIHDEAHARNALARVSQHGTPEEKKKVRAAVKRRYPHIVQEALELLEVKSSAYPSLERKPGKQNWVDYAGGLPSYIERIAKHIHYEGGKTISQAIAMAVSTVKRWCAGGSVSKGGASTANVSAKTKAKACAALAEWEAKKKKGSAAMRRAREAEEIEPHELLGVLAVHLAVTEMQKEHVLPHISEEEAARLAKEVHLIEAPFEGLHFDPRLHPRDRTGRFRDVLERLGISAKSGGVGNRVTLPKGVSVRKRGGEFEIRKRGGTVAKLKDPTEAARRALQAAGAEEPRERQPMGVQAPRFAAAFEPGDIRGPRASDRLGQAESARQSAAANRARAAELHAQGNHEHARDYEQAAERADERAHTLETLHRRSTARGAITGEGESMERPPTDIDRALGNVVGGPGLMGQIRAGDRVTIRTPQGQERTGRAVMTSSEGGWVLNMGGRHGTPGLVNERNVVAIRGKRVGDGESREPGGGELQRAMSAAWAHTYSQDPVPSDPQEVLRALNDRLLQTTGHGRRSRMIAARDALQSAIGGRGVEGPFTYPSGWTGRYDPVEGRYLGMDDIYMPRDFDPHTALPRPGGESFDLGVPERHQLRIARDVLKQNPAMAGVMGGPNPREAFDIVTRLTGRQPTRAQLHPENQHLLGDGESREPGTAVAERPTAAGRSLAGYDLAPPEENYGSELAAGWGYGPKDAAAARRQDARDREALGPQVAAHSDEKLASELQRISALEDAALKADRGTPERANWGKYIDIRRALQNEQTRRDVLKTEPEPGILEKLNAPYVPGYAGDVLGQIEGQSVRRTPDGKFEVYEQDRTYSAMQHSKFVGTADEVARYITREVNRERAWRSASARSSADLMLGKTTLGSTAARPTLSVVPDDWAVQHGYAEYVTQRGSRSNYWGTSQSGPEFTTIKWKSNVDPDRVIYHYLAGTPAPENFPKGSAAAEQWSYTGKGIGRKKADRAAVIRKLTGATLIEVARLLGWTQFADHQIREALAAQEGWDVKGVRLEVARWVVEARDTPNVLVEALVEILRERLRNTMPEDAAQRLQEARTAYDHRKAGLYAELLEAVKE